MFRRDNLAVPAGSPVEFSAEHRQKLRIEVVEEFEKAADLFAQSNHFQGQLLALEHVLKNSDLANMTEEQIIAKLEQMNLVKTII